MTASLFIIAAASGTGKTSLVRALCRNIDRLKVSISCTTRAMRPGEQEGIDYYFIDRSTFDSMVADNRFLEHKTVFGNQYGTPREEVERQLAAGNDIILEIDWQGAREVRKLLPEKCVSIFILPPSLASLEQRLRDRGQDEENVIQQRMREALDELRHFDEFDYLVVNDDFATALAELGQIIESRRRNEHWHGSGSDLHTFAEQLVTEGTDLQ